MLFIHIYEEISKIYILHTECHTEKRKCNKNIWNSNKNTWVTPFLAAIDAGWMAFCRIKIFSADETSSLKAFGIDRIFQTTQRKFKKIRTICVIFQTLKTTLS